MSEPEASHDVIAYKYGIIGDLPEPVIEEIRRARELRNALVAIEHGYHERLAAIWSGHPEVARVKEALTAADERLERLKAEAAAHRVKVRARRTPPELAAELKEARAQQRQAKEAVKQTQEATYPVVKPLIQQARSDRDARIKATYRTATEGGLYWATYNDVLAGHKRAVQAVAERRRQGLPAELRYRRWDGTGTVRVQLQRPAGAPLRTPPLLASGGGKWANVAQLSPWVPPQEWEPLSRPERRRIARTGRLRFRYGAGAHKGHAEVQVNVHRPLPPDADIVEIGITRYRIAGTYRAAATVLIRVPPVAPRTQGPLAAAHLGWRALPDGALRVAVLSGAGPVCGNVAGIVRDHGSWAEVVIPASWRASLDTYNRFGSQRDIALEHLKAWLLEWLDKHPEHREVLDPQGTMARWRSPRRFAGLALAHRDEPPAGTAEAIARIEDWRRQDRHLWEAGSNGRAQVIGRRRDAWRRVAAWLTTTPGLIVLDEWKHTTLARRPGIDQDDDHQARAARVNRQLAAPAELRSAIEAAAARRGVHTEQVTAPAVHAACGTALDPDRRARKIMVWCGHCETTFDQDVNAATLMLQVRNR